MSTTPIIAELDGGQEVLLGKRHVNLVLQCLVQNARVGQRRSLWSLSGSWDLSSSAPPRIWWEACLPGHVFVYWLRYFRLLWSHSSASVVSLRSLEHTIQFYQWARLEAGRREQQKLEENINLPHVHIQRRFIGLSFSIVEFLNATLHCTVDIGGTY